MRISDWSSDVCSSDLEAFRTPVQRFAFRRRGDACPISLTPYRILRLGRLACRVFLGVSAAGQRDDHAEFHGPCVMHHHQWRSEEHTSELQSLMRISYAVFCLKKKKKNKKTTKNTYNQNTINIETI